MLARVESEWNSIEKVKIAWDVSALAPLLAMDGQMLLLPHRIVRGASNCWEQCSKRIVERCMQHG